MQPQMQLNLVRGGIYIISDVFTSFQDVFGLFRGHLMYKVLFSAVFKKDRSLDPSQEQSIL